MRIIQTLFCIIFFAFGFSQENKYSDSEIEFLIGLINDSGGKSYMPTHPKEAFYITNFYAGQKVSLDSLKNRIERSKLKLTLFYFREEGEDSPNTKVYSETYSSLFNQFYRFRKANYTYIDENDKEFPLYIGKLKRKAFKTRKAKIQFLQGAYIRNGSKNNDGYYRYRFSNSISKYKLVRKFLRQTGSKILKTEVNENIVPVTTVFTFLPSKELAVLINQSR